MLRHRFVRQKHELFDDPVRNIPLGCDDRFDQPLIVEHDLWFFQVEVDRAAPMATLVQDLEQLPHYFENGTSSRYFASVSGSRVVRIAFTSVYVMRARL